MKKYINLFLGLAVLSVLLVSCFQDLDNDPPFNYPDDYIPDYNPLKVYLPLNGSEKNESNYRYKTIVNGGSFVDASGSKVFQGDEVSYVMAVPPASLTDTLMQLQSFTFSIWINLPRPDGVVWLASMPKNDHSRGYLELYFENNNNGDQAYIKGFMRSVPPGGAAKEQWIDVGSVQPEGSSRVEGVWNRWTHLAIRYDGGASQVSIFKDGEAKLLNRQLGTFGPLYFDPAFCNGNLIIGASGCKSGQTKGTQDAWVVNAKTIEGQYKNVGFYNKALSNVEINALYISQK
jgi:hypothetical protein